MKDQVSTFRKDNWAVISVSDDGPGIPDENEKQIFDMFYTGSNRVVDSRRSLGLGLSLCKSIINAHGGSISVSDNVPMEQCLLLHYQLRRYSYMNKPLILVVEDDSSVKNRSQLH